MTEILTEISLMGCDELKSLILFFLVHRLRIKKKQIWKSNNLADGMDHNRNDHDNWFWSAHETLLKRTICSQFCIHFFFFNFDRTFIPPIYFSKKCVFFCKRHTSFINFPLWLLQNLHLQIKEMYQTSLLKLLGFYAITYSTPSWWNI